MTALADERCQACTPGTPSLNESEVKALLSHLSAGWELNTDHHLEKSYQFPDFAEALKFTNQVGELAEEVGHHPDIFLSWGKVKLVLWTHSIQGLSRSDFIFAAKVDGLDRSSQ